MKKLLFLLLFPLLTFGQFNPIFFAGSVKKSPLLSNLAAYYKFDNSLIDATGFSPTGIETGIDYVSGKTGNAARFDSPTDRITMADNINFSFTDNVNDIPFSINMWVYFTGFSSTSNTLINKRGTATPGGEWEVSVNGSRLSFAKMDQNGNTIYQYIQSPLSLFSLNTWYNITVTDDGTKTVAGMKMYINSILITTINSSSGVYTGMIDSTSQVRFGLASYSTSAANTAHQGYIEDVGIWKNRVLTQSEINYLYNSGAGRTYPF